MIKKNKIDNLKLEILKSAKKNIIFDGWSNKILEKISKDIKISIDNIYSIFPKGCKDILRFYLNELDRNMIRFTSKKILKSLKTPEKIFYIINLRLEKNYKEKNVIKKTIHSLALPNTSVIS